MLTIIKKISIKIFTSVANSFKAYVTSDRVSTNVAWVFLIALLEMSKNLVTAFSQNNFILASLYAFIILIISGNWFWMRKTEDDNL